AETLRISLAESTNPRVRSAVHRRSTDARCIWLARTAGRCARACVRDAAPGAGCPPVGETGRRRASVGPEFHMGAARRAPRSRVCRGRRAMISQQLVELARCPDCEGALTRRGQAVVCTQCGRQFDASAGFLDLRPREQFTEQTKYLDDALH